MRSYFKTLISFGIPAGDRTSHQRKFLHSAKENRTKSRSLLFLRSPDRKHRFYDKQKT